ncbi:MAG: hypothetical protein KF721_03265 [Ignavibacteriaceae bacterium]|nr:hypothetical protein [Ignavibacteriaceae bacterium]
MKRLKALITVTLIVFSFACQKDNPVSTSDTQLSLSGKVVDESGKIISGAKIHYIPQFAEDTTGSSLTAAFRYSFSIPYSTNVTVVLLRHHTRDTVQYIYKNEYLSQGTYTLGPYQLTNGIYHYVVKYDTSEIDRKFLINMNENFLSELSPFKESDRLGVFDMSYKELGIGEIFGYQIADTTIVKTISNRFKVVIFKENYEMLVEEITVNTTIPISKVFTLKALANSD